MKSGIYKLENSLTGKCYVGSSINLASRKSHHFYLLRKGKSHSQRLQNSFNKHGEAAFQFEVIEYCEAESLHERERAWMVELDAVDNGYNTSLDVACPSRGLKHSERARANMSAGQRARERTPENRETARKNLEIASQKRRGSTLTPEHRQRISAANIGKKSSPETIEKHRQRLLLKPINHWLGKKRSPEDRAKMAAAKIGIPAPHLQKPIIQLSVDGAEIKEFPGTLAAAAALGMGRTAIKNNLAGRSKTCNGFIFKFK